MSDKEDKKTKKRQHRKVKKPVEIQKPVDKNKKDRKGEKRDAEMDKLQYQQYACVIRSGEISQDALARIIKHDASSGWAYTPGGLARKKVLKHCKAGKIKVAKLLDVEGDALYGNGWPLPLSFKEETCCARAASAGGMCACRCHV